MSMKILNRSWDYVSNARIFRNSREYAAVVPGYFNSLKPAEELREEFEDIHTYLMFIGIGRSGTTLIGALLAAHPGAVVANEESALKYMHPRVFSREQVYWLLLRNSREYAAGGRVGGGGYGYKVEGQWQGKHRKLEVIGDKSKSAQDVTWLTTSRGLLGRMARTTGARIRMMHVIRNPYDSIAARSYHRKLSLEVITREYFGHCERLLKLIRRIENESEIDVARIPVHLEDFIEDPGRQLSGICGELGLEAPEDYLRDCSRIVLKKPHKRRHEAEWDQRLIDEVARRIEGIPFFERYSFDE